MKKRIEDISKEVITAMKNTTPKENIQKRKDSGDVEVFNIEEIVVEKQKMAEANDAYFNAQIIAERQRDIDQIQALMTNMNAITNQLANVVESQDAKFMRIEQNARVTSTNTKKAKQEIITADENRGLANNKMYFGN